MFVILVAERGCHPVLWQPEQCIYISFSSKHTNDELLSHYQ